MTVEQVLHRDCEQTQRVMLDCPNRFKRAGNELGLVNFFPIEHNLDHRIRRGNIGRGKLRARYSFDEKFDLLLATSLLELDPAKGGLESLLTADLLDAVVILHFVAEINGLPGRFKYDLPGLLQFAHLGMKNDRIRNALLDVNITDREAVLFEPVSIGGRRRGDRTLLILGDGVDDGAALHARPGRRRPSWHGIDGRHLGGHCRIVVVRKQFSSWPTDCFRSLVQALTDSLLSILGSLIDGLGNLLSSLLRCTNLPGTGRDQNANENIFVSFGRIRPIGVLITTPTEQATNNAAFCSGRIGILLALVLCAVLLGIFLFCVIVHRNRGENKVNFNAHASMPVELGQTARNEVPLDGVDRRR
mmetsp:Transcript_17769/g.50847  ORF Transcript_17769/g.50847 Transcript_17769/m.50847 type:complete len:360 (+) Transcript_17769:3446-4525(+)